MDQLVESDEELCVALFFGKRAEFGERGDLVSCVAVEEWCCEDNGADIACDRIADMAIDEHPGLGTYLDRSHVYAFLDSAESSFEWK